MLSNCQFILTVKYLSHFSFPSITINTGNKTKLVMVATSNVTDVSQPRAKVPPKLLAQKMINPAVRTRDVYIMLSPVW